MQKKLIRITTVPESLGGLLKGQLNYMTTYFNVIGISSYGNGVLEKVSKVEGIEVISVEMTRQITPFKDLKAVFKLYKIFKNERPAIVHTHTPKAGTLGMIAAKLARVPHRLHTIAGLPLLVAKGPKRILLNWVEIITYLCATKIYPNSFGMYNIILGNGFTKQFKLKVLGNGSSNGIDMSYFDPTIYSKEANNKIKKSLIITDKDLVFIFVGRLVKDKGINELIGAFKILIEKHANIKLLLVGDFENNLDPLLDETLAFIRTSNKIISVGWQKDVRPYFSISDCLVFPSYREGFPNVVLQACAMGIHSIVTDINGCNEIIKNGQNGMIIPVRNVNSLYMAMDNYILGNVKFILSKLQIRELIHKNFRREEIWKTLLEEYNSLLES